MQAMAMSPPVRVSLGVFMGRPAKRELLPAFQTWLHARMEERGLGINALAEYGGFPSSSVSRWWNGKTLPDPANARRLAEFFQRPQDEALALAGHRLTEDREGRMVAIQAQITSLQRRDDERMKLLEKMAKDSAEQRSLLSELLEEVRRLGREQADIPDKPRLIGQAADHPQPEAQPPG